MKRDIEKIENLILDMDGVLWRGSSPMPGLTDLFDFLDRNKIGYVLATNNATKTAEMYKEHLAGFGVKIPARFILNSAEATARYLRHHFPQGRRAFIVGEKGLLAAMSSQGFEVFSGEDFISNPSQVDFVVVGFTRETCYPQLANAAHLINKGASFIGTNPDVSIPTEFGPLPGAGALLAFLSAATGKEPIVIGKPNLPLFREALEILDASPQTTAMVGDRMATDIAGAQSAGLRTILMLSGITKREDLDEAAGQPDFVLENLAQLVELLDSSD